VFASRRGVDASRNSLLAFSIWSISVFFMWTTLGLKLTGGYLQNTSYWQGTYTNVNELTLFHEAQFTPYGQYAGGLVEPFTNSNYLTGSNGTWASSNPLVMSVNQQGHVWTLTPGTANITFVSPAGVRFNMWTMTVKSYD
jgi:hypothetical protein